MLSSQRAVVALATITVCILVTHLYNNHHSHLQISRASTRASTASTPLSTFRRPTHSILWPSDHEHPEAIRTALNRFVSTSAISDKPTQVDCRDLPGASDIVVILKTGASELYDKLPTHFLTNFRCAPDFLIFSDLEQSFGEFHVHDSLLTVSEHVKETHWDFAFYRQLKAYGAAGGDLGDLKGKKSWALDKWKFLPMIDRAYTLAPKKKWYVFVEADTYLSWSNLLIWLSKPNPADPIYSGAPVRIEETKFAHGGSGFIMSAPAARAVFTAYPSHKEKWEEMTSGDCCGDRVLADALLQDAKIPILPSFPLLQGEKPDSLDWTAAHWCRPAVTWHHVSASEIDALWQFEQAWVAERGWHEPILYADVFANFVAPHINTTLREDWDNTSRGLFEYREDRIYGYHAEAEAASVANAEKCKQMCEKREKCLQWVWHPSPGTCRGSSVIRLGRADVEKEGLPGGIEEVIPKKGHVSGWMLERIERFKLGLEPCKSEGMWVLNTSFEAF
ncbi:hypothetical protein LTR50_007203 [Elasticomyces elasticus]|nr:hypothetical protein LTR50_007203 [Elasticomyces elasticus]